MILELLILVSGIIGLSCLGAYVVYDFARVDEESRKTKSSIWTTGKRLGMFFLCISVVLSICNVLNDLATL